MLLLLTLTGCKEKEVISSTQIFAMDTFMTIDIYGTDENDCLEKAKAEIERLDSLWSIQYENSEISCVNNNITTKLSDDTRIILEKTIAISKDTNYALDLTVYPLMELWGFVSKDYAVPNKESIDNTLLSIGMDNIVLNGNELTLTNGAKIDLGSVAKGYATDNVKNILINNDVHSALINLGGNLYALGLKNKNKEWNLAIANPDTSLFKNDSVLGIVKLHDKALVTSGNYNRYFEDNGKRYHHIMDSQTGYPAENGLISVSIISEDATLADALSTALFVMGKEEALKYYDKNKEKFDVVLVENTGEITITDGLKKCFSSNFKYKVH